MMNIGFLAQLLVQQKYICVNRTKTLIPSMLVVKITGEGFWLPSLCLPHLPYLRGFDALFMVAVNDANNSHFTV